jgi:hypothetical protein
MFTQNEKHFTQKIKKILDLAKKANYNEITGYTK